MYTTLKIDVNHLNAIELIIPIFIDIYFSKKSENFNTFELKSFSSLSYNKKLEFNEEEDFSYLLSILKDLFNRIEVYKYIKEDDIFLMAGSDIYEVVHMYEEKVEKILKDYLKQEYIKLKGKSINIPHLVFKP